MVNRGDAGMGFPVGSFQATPNGAGTAVNSLGNPNYGSGSGSQSPIYANFTAAENIPAGSLVVEGSSDALVRYSVDPNSANAAYRPLLLQNASYQAYSSSSIASKNTSALYHASIPKMLPNGRWVVPNGMNTVNQSISVVDVQQGVLYTYNIPNAVSGAIFDFDILTNGNIVLAYVDATLNVVFSILNNQLQLLSGPTAANTAGSGTSYSNGGVTVGALPNGNFAMGFIIYNLTANPSLYSPCLAIFGPTGATVVAAFPMNTSSGTSGELYGGQMKIMPNGNICVALDWQGFQAMFGVYTQAGALIAKTQLQTAVGSELETQIVVNANYAVLIQEYSNTKYAYVFNQTSGTITSTSWSDTLTQFSSLPIFLPSGNIAFLEAAGASAMSLSILNPATVTHTGTFATTISAPSAEGPCVALYNLTTAASYTLAGGENVGYMVGGTVYTININYSSGSPVFSQSSIAAQNAEKNTAPIYQFAATIANPYGYTSSLIWLVSLAANGGTNYFQAFYSTVQNFEFVGVCVNNVLAGQTATIQVQGSAQLNTQIAYPFTSQYASIWLNLLGNEATMQTSASASIQTSYIGAVSGTSGVTWIAPYPAKININYTFSGAATINFNGIAVATGVATYFCSGIAEIYVNTGQTVTIVGSAAAATAIVSAVEV